MLLGRSAAPARRAALTAPRASSRAHRAQRLAARALPGLSAGKGRRPALPVHRGRTAVPRDGDIVTRAPQGSTGRKPALRETTLASCARQAPKACYQTQLSFRAAASATQVTTARRSARRSVSRAPVEPTVLKPELSRPKIVATVPRTPSPAQRTSPVVRLAAREAGAKRLVLQTVRYVLQVISEKKSARPTLQLVKLANLGVLSKCRGRVHASRVLLGRSQLRPALLYASCVRQADITQFQPPRLALHAARGGMASRAARLLLLLATPARQERSSRLLLATRSLPARCALPEPTLRRTRRPFARRVRLVLYARRTAQYSQRPARQGPKIRSLAHPTLPRACLAPPARTATAKDSRRARRVRPDTLASCAGQPASTLHAWRAKLANIRMSPAAPIASLVRQAAPAPKLQRLPSTTARVALRARSTQTQKRARVWTVFRGLSRSSSSPSPTKRAMTARRASSRPPAGWPARSAPAGPPASQLRRRPSPMRAGGALLARGAPAGSRHARRANRARTVRGRRTCAFAARC